MEAHACYIIVKIDVYFYNWNLGFMNIGKYFLEVFILIQRITNLIEHIIFLKIFFSLRRIQSLVILHNKNKKTKTKTKNKKQKTKKNKTKQKRVKEFPWKFIS